MSSSFPLYDMLIRDCKDADLTTEQKRAITTEIPRMDSTAHTHIFTLIRIHGLKTRGTGDVFDIPYGGEKQERNIRFNLETMPNILKQMIYRFVCVHNKN
jgi:hypothetical protein